MNGTIFVTGVRHEISAGKWHSRAQFGLEEKWFAERVGMSGNIARSAEGRIHTTSGLCIGVVTELADPEGAGRVQVKLPSVDPDGEGVWARYGNLAAGAEHGSFFLPEIEDAVQGQAKLDNSQVGGEMR